jgi:hypothetical protein
LEDETWKEYFTKEELNEIREYQEKGVIEPPLELKQYLDGLTQDDVSSKFKLIFDFPKANHSFRT